jgi:hypothetical protein
VVLRGEIGHKNFSLLDLRTGAQRMLAELPADFVIRDFDVSTAGSEIVFFWWHLTALTSGFLAIATG